MSILLICLTYYKCCDNECKDRLSSTLRINKTDHVLIISCRMLVPLKLSHPSLCFKPTVHPKCSMYPNSCIFHHVFYFSKHLLACVKCIHSEFKTFPPRICTFLLFYTRQKYNQNVTKAIESPVDKKNKNPLLDAPRVEASETLSEIASSGISPKTNEKPT